MKIVILDAYTENPGDLSWGELEKFGEVKVYDRVSYEESPAIAEAIGDADIAIINKTGLLSSKTYGFIRTRSSILFISARKF